MKEHFDPGMLNLRTNKFRQSSQLHEFWAAHDEIALANATFMQVQAGPEPLTNDEIERLAQRRPKVWLRFRGMGK